ncbi:unnamed protein product [Rotaria sp. Silwood1]|nr:unnamed protein product [Rotaria sp. Silwood1]CAF4755611.1 unnamed protein product [Rotaria sp. Silwood1]
MSFRIVTWNVGNSEPDCNTCQHLAFSSVSDGIKADLIVFGFQEASKKMIGLNTFHKTLKTCLENENYVEIISDYVGSNIVKPIWLYIYASNIIVKSQRVKLLKCGNKPTLKVYQDKILENIIGYKGVIASCIQIDKLTNIIFANMHLPAGEGKKEERCKLWSKFLQIYHANNIKNDYMFVFGDQNWRTLNTLSINNIIEAVQKKEYKTILDNDELTQMRQNDNEESTAQCLSNFIEASITFPPTYKYILNSDEYQTEKDKEIRRPSYTDRILISTLSNNLEILQYSAMSDIKLSDHRPVFADIMLHQRSSNDEIFAESYNQAKVHTTQAELLHILAIYHFVIKCKTRNVDIRQVSSIDLSGTQSDRENTVTQN